MHVLILFQKPVIERYQYCALNPNATISTEYSPISVDGDERQHEGLCMHICKL